MQKRENIIEKKNFLKIHEINKKCRTKLGRLFIKQNIAFNFYYTLFGLKLKKTYMDI